MKGKKKGAAQLYLERIEILETQIERKEDKKQRLYCLATKCTSSMSASGAAGGGNQDKMAPSDACMDLEAEIEQDKRRLKDMIGEACDLLALVPNKKHYDVLYKHYIEYKQFEQVSVEMHFTYRNTHYLHGRALQVFEKLLEEHRRKEDAAQEEALIVKGREILEGVAAKKIAYTVTAADIELMAKQAAYHREV